MRAGLSILFTATNTGLPAFCRMRATSSSSVLMPALPSTRKMMTSASRAPSKAWARMEPWKASPPISMPPVSMSMNSTPFQSALW